MSQNSGSFFLLTYAEIRAFNWLKALFFLLESAEKKRTAQKRNGKKNRSKRNGKKNRSKRNGKKNRFFGTCKPAKFGLGES